MSNPRLQSDVFIGKSKWDGLLLPCKNRLFLAKYVHWKNHQVQSTQKEFGNGNPLLVENMLHSNTPGSTTALTRNLFSKNRALLEWPPPRVTVTIKMTFSGCGIPSQTFILVRGGHTQKIHQYFHLFQANSVIGVESTHYVPDSKFAGIIVNTSGSQPPHLQGRI